jgi:hypothetical protein
VSPVTGALLVFATLVWAYLGFAGWRTTDGLPSLKDLTGEAPPGGFPPLSVIVPCRDEAATVLPALRSLLGQDYPGLDVVAIDDRSGDATGQILDDLSRLDPRLRVLHVRDLPAGWLGKTHACHRGSQVAGGRFLLFTDADVLFSPEALRRAVGYAVRHRLGHLVTLPSLIAPGFLERALVATFAILACAKFRVWELNRAGTAGFVGVGAFNLVEHDAYERAGGHARLALEVVDDVKLGLVLRRSGVPQAALDSGGLVRVRWNPGFRATLGGLVKNVFAAAEWRWWPILWGAALGGAASLGPLLAVLLLPSRLFILPLLPILLTGAVHAGAARRIAGGRGLEGAVYPFCDAALLSVGLWSALRATLRGGIEWRGTRYPLSLLRQGCVREAEWSQGAAVGWD